MQSSMTSPYWTWQTMKIAVYWLLGIPFHIVIHEGGHWLAAKVFGMRPHAFRVDVFRMTGAVTIPLGTYARWQCLAMLAAGPLVNLLTGVLGMYAVPVVSYWIWAGVAVMLWTSIFNTPYSDGKRFWHMLRHYEWIYDDCKQETGNG